MPSARTLCLAISLWASLSTMGPAFAQSRPRPELHPRDETPFDQNRLVGFDAVAHQLTVELAKAGQKKVIFFDFHGMFWSPFAAWLADQLTLSFGGAGDSIAVIERDKLAVYEPIEGFLFRPGTAKSRVAQELGADTVVNGVYRPASNGVGVSLTAYRVSNSGDAATIDTSSIVTVTGNIPYTEEIGSKVYLPLDALWTNGSAPAGQRMSSPSCLYCPNPHYSSEAHKQKLEGTVLLGAGITTDGRAVQITVVKSLGSGLDEQAIADLKTWRFRPATYADGRLVSVYLPIEITFRLD
jgi:TonB family protein